ncbi:hypothetical protein BH09PSE3_BH09PSE3_27000 [soil metagenome]
MAVRIEAGMGPCGACFIAVLQGLGLWVEGFDGGHGRAVQGLAARSVMARSR